MTWLLSLTSYVNLTAPVSMLALYDTGESAVTLDHFLRPRCESRPRSRALLWVLVLAGLLPTGALAQSERGFQLRVPGVLLIPGAPPRATGPRLRAPSSDAPDASPPEGSEAAPGRSVTGVLANITAETSPPHRAHSRASREERPGLFRASRLLIASGSVLLTTGIPLALMSRGGCYDRPPEFTPRAAAVTLAGGGLLTLLGALALRLAHRRLAPNGMSRRERSRLGGFVILSYLTLGGTLSVLGFLETQFCHS